MTLLAGGTLIDNRYRILRMVGSGGFGAVYETIDTAVHDRKVALKQMLEGAQDDNYSLVRFEAECEILLRLRHPLIPQFYHHFHLDDGGYFLAMEYVEGVTLEHWIEKQAILKQPADMHLILRWALQICQVLEFLHGQPQPILHRDVKPQNLILKDDGETLMLVDFGLARSIDTTMTRTQVGTVGYAPLEQIRGRPEPCSDIYSLGATMYHLLTGKRPTPFAVAPLEDARPDLPQRLCYIVNMAVDPTPARRFISAARMRNAIEDLQRELAGEAPATPELVIAEAPPLVHTALDDATLESRTAAPPSPGSPVVRWVTVGVAVIVTLAWLHHLPSASAPPPPPVKPVALGRALSVLHMQFMAPNDTQAGQIQGLMLSSAPSAWHGAGVFNFTGALQAPPQECAGLEFEHDGGTEAQLPASISVRLQGETQSVHLALLFGGSETHFVWDGQAWNAWPEGVTPPTPGSGGPLQQVVPSGQFSEPYTVSVQSSQVTIGIAGKTLESLPGSFAADKTLRFIVLPDDRPQTVKLQDLIITTL